MTVYVHFYFIVKCCISYSTEEAFLFTMMLLDLHKFKCDFQSLFQKQYKYFSWNILIIWHKTICLDVLSLLS